MVSRTSAAKPSAPLRKSTGLVATITRTAPVGPITRWPSAHAVPPQPSSPRRRGRSELSRNQSQPQLSRRGPPAAACVPHGAVRLPAVAFPRPRAQTAALPCYNTEPRVAALAGANRITAAAIAHGGAPLPKPPPQEQASPQQGGLCRLRKNAGGDPSR